MLISQKDNLRYNQSRQECNDDIINFNSIEQHPYHSVQDSLESDNYGSDRIPKGARSMF